LAAADLELVHVRVRPAHRRLNQFMQFLKRHVLRLNTSPDRRARPAKREFRRIEVFLAAV
jgi:hypothetical protein